jgi:hypothetical protein
MLERLLAAAGGREAWEAAQGLRLDVLETRYSVLDRVKDRWAVHHYVPRLCAFDLLGRGYVWSEFGEFQDGEPHPDFTREVYDGAVSWAEHGPQYFRAPENAVQAGSRVRKQFLLGAMPFSIPALGGKLAYARSESVMLGPAGGRAQRIGIERRAAEVDVFVLRLPFESAIVMESEGREEISEFLLLVEQGTDRVVRLQYVLTDSDRHAVQAPYTWASVDFDGVVELGALRLPKLCGQWSEDPLACNGYLTADPHAEALAPEALRKPWLGSPVFVPPFRADEWDPPADRARPEPRTGPDARRRGKRGLERGDTPRDGAGGAESEDGSDGRR